MTIQKVIDCNAKDFPEKFKIAENEAKEEISTTSSSEFRRYLDEDKTIITHVGDIHYITFISDSYYIGNDDDFFD